MPNSLCEKDILAIADAFAIHLHMVLGITLYRFNIEDYRTCLAPALAQMGITPEENEDGFESIIWTIWDLVHSIYE